MGDLSSARSTLRRKKERGQYTKEVIYSILDEALICHVGYLNADGPVVLPMVYARMEDKLYLHGAVGNHMLRSVADGLDVCVTITLIDGLVLARSAFHHSVNYRSVVLFGQPDVVADLGEKRDASVALVEQLCPGRGTDARVPSDTELKKILMLRLPIEEGSAKIRTGDPIDDDDDIALDIWAGVIPTTLSRKTPIPSADLRSTIPSPPYLDFLIDQ
jgi:nitroimidazol reductase NimA-like FMN-containing flavoprotein (pyridoxamine 5'-phosphate oxidase superfamily)